MASRFSRSLGPLRDAARTVRQSLVLQNARIFAGRQLHRLSDGGTLDVDLAARIGMGALLAYALRLHAHAELTGRRATIVSTSRLYGTGGDVFGEYFHRPVPAKGWKPDNALVNEWLLLRAAPWTMSLDSAHRLFREHFRPKPVLEQHIGEPFDLSIHFRGTDKVAESGFVARDAMLAAIDGFAPARGKGKSIFLATDEPAFELMVRERFPLARFATFNLGEVADGQARHFSKLSPGDKALEALVNVFQIANARVCVRTSSYLSAMSRIVNPDLRTHTINVNRFSQIFPEDQILIAEASDFPPLTDRAQPC